MKASWAASRHFHTSHTPQDLRKGPQLGFHKVVFRQRDCLTRGAIVPTPSQVSRCGAPAAPAFLAAPLLLHCALLSYGGAASELDEVSLQGP